MRAVVVLAMLTATGSVALATPVVARLAEDLDGNGSVEPIELFADGMLSIGAARVRVATQATGGKIQIARYNKRTQIVVDIASSATAREAVVLEPGGREIVRFPLGGVGLDGEHQIEVEGGPAGVIRYQTRWDIRRCDGKPAYLFAERLDGTTFRPVTGPIATLPSKAPAIAPRLDPGPAPAPLLFQARSASHQAGANDAGALAIPSELDDARPDTLWREDLTASGGEGQFFTFQPRIDTARAHQLRIVPGNPASATTIRAFNRPRAFAIVAHQGAWRVELPDAANDALGAAYIIDFPQPISGCVTIVLESVYGRPAASTAIAELEVFAEGERAGGGEVLLARMIAEGKNGALNAAAALGKRGAPGAAAIDAELAKTTDAGARRRLVGALVKIRDPAASPALVRAASAGWVRDKDLVDVIGALAANGQVQALRDLAAKAALPVEIRRAAVSRITPTGAGFDALVDLAGQGPHELRHEIIERLALAPGAQLAASAASETDAPAAGDVWRALTRRARGHAADRPAAVAAMSAALPTAVDYERRYRLIDGIAAHGDATALRALDAMLRGLPADAQSSALRQVAVRGIATAPRADAIAMVIALADDPDPGVRLAALSALATAETDAATPWHSADGPAGIDRVIVARLATDTWPEVRRKAATALGARCQRAGPAGALLDAVSRDLDIDVRRDALGGLVQCKAAGIRELLLGTWENIKLPPELRVHAIDLVVTLGDAQLAAKLVGRLGRWRGEAIESKASLVLAQSACAVLGRMNPPGAAQALLAALDDTAFPEIVGAAAFALGVLGPACPPQAKAKLTALSRADDQSAVAARHAVAEVW